MNRFRFYILAFFSCLLIGVCKAGDYYVDAGAPGGGNGSVLRPFSTIQQAASVLKPGDICHIRGGTYFETVVPHRSGLSGQEIVFKTIPGTGGVTISGADPVAASAWERVTGDRYRAKVRMHLGHENQVFKGDRMMYEARWPNSGDDLLCPNLSVMDEGSDPETIVDDELPDLDWTGASAWVHAPKYWSNWTTRSTGYSKGTLAIENLAPYPGPNRHVAAPGAGYYIYGCLSALDTSGEWYYDAREGYLYTISAGKQSDGDKVFVKQRMYAFDFSGLSHIRVEGIGIFGASINMDERSAAIVLDRLTVLYPYHSAEANKHYGDQTDKGIVFSGRSCIIRNSEIAYSSGCGLVLDGYGNQVVNCYVHDTDYIGTYASCIQLKGKRNVISHCTLRRSGRAVIDYAGMYQALIQFCDLSESGMLTSDTGLTYGNVIEGGNSEVRYNWLHDNQDKHLAMGLYYDHGTQNILSHHNLIWGVDDFGLLINHYSYYHQVYNNTFVSERIGFRSRWGNKYEPDLYGCRFYNNIFSHPCETNAGNYIWAYNIENYKALDTSHKLSAASPCIDAGVLIGGINEEYTGIAPDLGAYEYGGIDWKPGHDFDDPPVVDTSRSETLFSNRISNSAFEHEDHIHPWDSVGMATIEYGFKNHTTPDTAVIRMGRYSISLEKNAEIFQDIEGLEPDAWYEFAAFLRVDQGERATIGIETEDGAAWCSPSITGSSPGWDRCVVRYRTGPEQDRVRVFIRRISEGPGKVYVDDCGFVYISPDEGAAR